eukprot:3178218-Prymnesium_polylepis.1
MSCRRQTCHASPQLLWLVCSEGSVLGRPVKSVVCPSSAIAASAWAGGECCSTASSSAAAAARTTRRPTRARASSPPTALHTPPTAAACRWRSRRCRSRRSTA